MANMFVVGVFRDKAEAESVEKDLKDHKIKSKDIDVITRDSAEAGGGAGAAAVPDVVPFLRGIGVPEADARMYNGAIGRGNALVVAGVKDMAHGQQAVDVMLAHRGGGPLLERERATEPVAQRPVEDPERRRPIEPPLAEPASRRPAERPGEAERVIPIVEEELRVGKRKVNRSRVHIYTRVVEQPVESEISLRDERITVMRRPVDRPATEEELRESGSIDITESVEEPVIAKEPHVVEEVVISREGGEHTEKIHDTVKKTEVEIEGADEEKPRGKP